MTPSATPRPMILAGSALAGVLFSLAIHMIGRRFGLDLGALLDDSSPQAVPLGGALAWWATTIGAFGGGYAAARLMVDSKSGGLPAGLRYLLIALGVVLLAAAGQAAAAPSLLTSGSGVVAGLAALVLGTIMAFCGAQFALRT